jgi:hypothetical protein
MGNILAKPVRIERLRRYCSFGLVVLIKRRPGY